MTDADKPSFAVAFSRLALATRDDRADAAVERLYAEALSPLEIEFVVIAAQRLMINEWFPKVGEWYREALAVERERRELHAQWLRRLPEPLCGRCRDTGWAPDVDHRVRRCTCEHERRLELLGRQPCPAFDHVATKTRSDDLTILKSVNHRTRSGR